MLRLFVALLASAILATSAAAQVPFALREVATGLDQPVFATAPEGDPRLFIVEKTGRILVIEGSAIAPRPFLDLSALVSSGGEQGLLGLAFHPDYAANGRFYVNYTDRAGDTQVVAYAVSADPGVADPASATPLFSVAQPYRNHNGGWIGFGPDGLLYIGMGDGGSGGDPEGRGQDPRSPLGKILRIDVDTGGAPEVFVSGVRNPWRNAFDGEDLYIADVGQSGWEEINIVPLDQAGANLGWSVMEGFGCFRAERCDQAGLTLPLHAYATGEGCSITGGYVYRGAAIAAIDGLYFFADYCSGILSSLRHAGDGVTDLTSYADAIGSIGNVTSFGTDGAGELYVMTQQGRLLQFAPPAE